VRQANHWQRTPGKVLSAKSVARRVRTAETTSGAVAGADLQLRNFAEVTYEYRVGTRRFTGHRISLGEDLGDFQVAETLQRYPAGSQVTVYYNPDKPSRRAGCGAPEGVWRTMIIHPGPDRPAVGHHGARSPRHLVAGRWRAATCGPAAALGPGAVHAAAGRRTAASLPKRRSGPSVQGVVALPRRKSLRASVRWIIRHRRHGGHALAAYLA
jgi:hypothetical protein